MQSEGDRSRRLFAALVTFRRPAELVSTLEAVGAQTRRPERLIVVDNDPTPETAATVARIAPDAEYIGASENLGPAGGIALAMEQVLAEAADSDWIITIDDDDPPYRPTLFAELEAFADEMARQDPATGGVGVSGVRFSRTSGRIVRVPDHELTGPVPVDAIAGNQFPWYSVGAVQRVGPFRRDLFFGFEELEFGLRLRDAGYSLYGNGDEWLERRRATGRLGRAFEPSRTLGAPSWRRYYSLRNLVRILCDRRCFVAAFRVSVLAGLAKPILNAMRDPTLARKHLVLNVRALRDAWTRRMGRTVEPDA